MLRCYLVVVWFWLELEPEDGDWLLDDEGLELLPEVPSPLEALLVVSLPLEGLPLEPLEVPPPIELPRDDELPDEPELPEDELEPELPDDALELPEPHCCCAASVRGPMMPSTGPGSHPCDFSCCCSWRTESVPPLLLPLLEPELPIEDELLEGDWLEDELDDGDWLADCDDLDADCLEVSDDEVLDCANAVPEASRAATAMASFLEVIPIPFLWEVGRSTMALRGRAPARARHLCKRCARNERGMDAPSRIGRTRMATAA